MYRAFTLILFCIAVFSCSPELQLARKIGVKKKRMEQAIVSKGKDGKEKVRSLTGQYLVRKERIYGVSKDTVLFQQAKELKPGKFGGPFFNADSLSIYYLRLLSRKAVPYPAFSVAQVHRAFGIGTKSFNEKIAEVVSTCQEKEQLLSTVLEAYKEDTYIGVGMVMPIQGEQISRYRSQIHDFLLNAPVYAVRVSEPVEFPHTTITELLQKTEPTTYRDHIEFARIDVQRARPLKKER